MASKKKKKTTRKAAGRSKKKTSAKGARKKKAAGRAAAGAKKGKKRPAPRARKKAARRVPSKKKRAASGKKRPTTTKKRASATKRRAPLRRAAAKRAPAPRRDSAYFDHFRQRLLADRQQIMRRLDELREELSGIEETPREMEEWAQEEKDRDILIRLEERETEELRKIQAALSLIDTREYGKCQVCGKPIPRDRLEELPTAFRCVECTP